MDLPVIGAYVVAAGSAVWTLWSTRHVAGLESKLRRQEEAFRLLHSPRVTGAVKVWAAFCEFERALRAYVSPARIVSEPPNATEEEKDRALAEQVARERDAVAVAWQKFKVLHDESEVLLPRDVFESFTDLYKTFETAHSARHLVDLARDELTRAQVEAKSSTRILELMEEADRKRPAVVAALRKLIAGD